MLGPSGSGKTTCLRLIAGFEEPDAGEIALHGQSVLGVPPYDRRVNTVFQDYALFPHMSVLDNVAYGLMVRGVAKAVRHRRAAGDAGAGGARRARRPPAGGALGRPASAGGARARPDHRARGAAARRAARRPRPEAAPADADRAEGAAAPGRHHLHLRHARPGGSARHERPPGRVQPRPGRAGRHAGGDLRAAGDRVRRGLRRRLQHRRRGGRRAADRPAPGLLAAPRADPHRRRRRRRAWRRGDGRERPVSRRQHADRGRARWRR